MEEPEVDFTPRAYQVDLYEKAVAQNTIIYLPTGSGKTYIVVMVIKKYSNQVQLPYTQGGKRILFIVNTVPLVSQQAAYISRHTGLSCKGYSGDMGVDYWVKDQWLAELNEHQVLVMVGAIFDDILRLGHTTLDKVCLIIFDECHKGVGNHPMRSIMQRFERYKKEDHPRVLGLTATLLNANIKVENVENTIRDLEITFHSRVATVDSASSVQEYGKIKETFHLYDPPALYGVEDELMAICNYSLDVIKAVKLEGTYDSDMSSKELRPKSKNDKLKNIVEDTREHILTTGLYGGAKGILMHMIQLECIKKFSYDVESIGILEFLVTQMTKMRKIIYDRMNEEVSSEGEQMKRFSSDQILKTFAVLKHFNENKLKDQKFCCIIFVRRRTTAQILYHILKNLRQSDENFQFLNPEYMVGYENNPYRKARETLCLSKWNKQSLQRFRSGQCNCIVATDVVDEGVDVPTCTLIMRYDLPLDFRGYVQSKGRARDKAGLYVMLRERKDESFCLKYQGFKRIELFLEQALVGHSDKREEVTAEEIDEKLYKTELTPYIVVCQDGTEAIVTGLSSISLINRYCTNLMKSKFVNLTPTWKLTRIEHEVEPDRYKVSLTLPHISPLKETIDGDIMGSIPLAKRAAALKTCIKLHKIGELSDNLQPIEPSAILKNIDDLFPHWVEEPKSEAADAGTTSRKRQHKIEFPECLYSAFPVAEKPLYLHVIQAKPTYPKPYENRTMVFYDLLNDDAGFGILSTKPMPNIPSFPIFMNVGELNVTIQANHSTFTLSAQEIFALRLLHWIIFHKVLNVVKQFMAFDTENLSNSFLVVPTDALGRINWEVVNKYKNIDEVPSAETTNIRDYDLALVKPNYRSSSSVYVVTQICEDIMAESSFPTEEYYSYVHYYKERHGLIIRDTKQPMLEVKTISKNINCIRPRGPKEGLSKRKRADLLEDFQEHFIGELCTRIVFPALYWLKATYLPSVLHRVCQMLVAEDLRIEIVNEAHLGVLKLKPGSTWPPLRITQTAVEEPAEAPLDITEWTANDSGFSTEREKEISGPEIDTLGMDSKLYPWTKDEEPANLYRDIERIQPIDIEYYHQFMSTPIQGYKDFNTWVDVAGRSHAFENNVSEVPAGQTPPLKILMKEDPNGPSPVSIMQALTSKMSHDVFDLERLETLGDSFLKFAVSMYLFATYPKCNEGQLSVIKGKIIGNRNLFYCGSNKRIPGRIKVEDFVPDSNFMTPSYCAFRPLQELLLENEVSPNVLYEMNLPKTEQLTGFPSERTQVEIEERVLQWCEKSVHSDMQHYLGQQVVPDKTVSDSVEALIGVYLSSMSLKGAFNILKWFEILPSNLKVNDLLDNPPESPRVGNGNPNDHLLQANFIEKQIGYKFRDRSFLLQAFTHPSYTPNNITPSYERLEFLGDAILDFLITVHIYQSCDYLSPGALTDLRSALVNNIIFACLAVKYGFHTALMAYAPELQKIIERFVKFQQERSYAVDDELLWVLLEEEECMMAEYVDVPKILGDIFESLIGAVYLDSGKNLNTVWKIVYGLMKSEIDSFSKNVPKQPVRVIYETPGANPRFTKSTIAEGTNSVMVTLEAVIKGKPKIFHGFGANKKQAKCAAAKQALKCIRSNV